MTTDDIRLMRLRNQHLLEKTDPMTVVQDLCGLQAQFLSCALHALDIRSHSPDMDGMVKGWTNRGTMHLLAEEDLPLFLHQGRKRFLRPADTLDADECMSASRKAYFAELIVDAIGRGIDEREMLKNVCESAGMTEAERDRLFDPWGGIIRALCEAGRICHKPQEKKAYRLCPPFVPMEEEAARLELARRYFTHYGPAEVKDAAGFFGWTQAQVRTLLKRLPAEEISVGGKTYFHISQGEQEAPGEYPECLFLAGFDQLMLGYAKQDSLFLPQEHIRGIYNLAGIVHPAVLVRGTVIGRWKKKNRRLEITLFSPADQRSVSAAAEALWNDIGGIEFS